MKIVIAVNAFKGSISSIDAGKAISRGIRKSYPKAEILICPVADGGDGLLDVIKSLHGVKTIRCSVFNPRQRKISAEFCWLPKLKTVFIEMALASGLALVPENLRNPMKTTSYGTGQLIARALKLNPKKIILGIGGSATCEGGTGAAAALGAVFSDKRGNVIPVPSGADLENISCIDISETSSLFRHVRIEIICDVDNPLLGPKGSARIYAPQKGATPMQVRELEHGLANFADKVRKHTGRNINKIKGGGAAGGISAGFQGLFGAKLRKGIDLVFELVELEEKIKGADLVITGEGRIDSQTRYGKAPAGVAKLAKKHKVPCIAICGSSAHDISGLKRIGISSVWPICKAARNIDDSMKNARAYLEKTAIRAISVINSSDFQRGA